MQGFDNPGMFDQMAHLHDEPDIAAFWNGAKLDVDPDTGHCYGRSEEEPTQDPAPSTSQQPPAAQPDDPTASRQTQEVKAAAAAAGGSARTAGVVGDDGGASDEMDLQERVQRGFAEALASDMDAAGKIVDDAVAREEVGQLEVGDDLAPFVILKLTDSDSSRAMWPHKFQLIYKVWHAQMGPGVALAAPQHAGHTHARPPRHG